MVICSSLEDNIALGKGEGRGNPSQNLIPFVFIAHFCGKGKCLMTTEQPLDYQVFLTDLEDKLANIESERLALEAKEAALKSSIASVKRFMALESGEATPPTSDQIIVPKRAFKGMIMIDAMKKYLTMAKTGQTVAQFVDALKQGGFETASKFMKDNVRTALRRHGPGRGVVQRGNLFWLEEWPYTPRPAEEPAVNHAQDNQPMQESSEPIG